MPGRLMVVHNAYIHYGGEDACVAQELEVLRETDWDIHEFIIRTSDNLESRWKALGALFGKGVEQTLEHEIMRIQPDVVHVHNLFPLFSPRVFNIAHQIKSKVILTLHNYRPLCLNGLFLTPAGR